MSGIVRNSKYRHVFGKAGKKEECYEGFNPTNSASDGNFIAANEKFIACCITVGGGGAFIVIPIEKTGRLEPDFPKVSAHKEFVLDLQFNPFNDNMLASCSEDGTIKLWDIPDNGFVTNIDDSKALLTLEYHERKCCQLAWHPIASNVLLSVSQEPKVCIWNLEEGVAEVEITSHPQLIYSASWSCKGDKIVTSCKDKKFRIFDARSGDCLVEGGGHEGSKPSRVIFTFDDTLLFSTGFSKMSERQYACWEISGSSINNLDQVDLDTANNVLIPTYDADTQVVFLSAKGDSNIRYYELVNEKPYFYYIDTYTTNAPQRGLGAIPKRNVNVNICEIARFYKLHSVKTGYIEPTSFCVPRKSELFQSDLYPDCVSVEPALEAGEWFEGKDAEPRRLDMKELFQSKTKTKAVSSGGLKKVGGLKGLKAKKDAKTAAKSETKKSDDVKKTAEHTAEESSVAATSKESPHLQKSSAVASQPAIDSKEVHDLKEDIRLLKEADKKNQKELKELRDKIKDYDKITNDIKLLCDAVKKNDERISVLENMVESEEEEGGE
ncbi:coronin-6 isoform X1 [Hydra vulgaris]|uniref:coronin-6 isoform X1 n=1 Tax=Hydra vulgaris TaxID=6087 RepID=UPI001F5F6988|nr:coronin-6 isoform X1 [Hydra vulgaris]